MIINTQKNPKKQKLVLEIESAKRQKELGLDSLLVLDDLMHNVFEMARFGLKKHFPNASDEEILGMMREQAIKKSKKR